MNLLILHYHLNRGGVTRVIENQLAALDRVLDPAKPWRVAVAYGGRREGWHEQLADRLQNIELSLHEISALEYDNLRSEKHSAVDLLMELYCLLGQLQFGPQDTILHLHNHTLGKNYLLPEVVPILAQDGYGLLLQLHDFAEDFRSENYRAIAHLAKKSSGRNDNAGLYPQSPSTHYAVLNGRDQRVLKEAGVAESCLHWLPNPVPDFDDLPSRETARAKFQQLFDVAPEERLLLYPVRCIRRKNLGEALLLGALAPAGTTVASTLAPLNPLEQPLYEQWKQTADKLKLSVRFEVGAPGKMAFDENLAAADAILTTSVTEGFGMVFLEAWLAGRALIGRDLPEITADFTEAGLRYDWLHSTLRVPVDWIGEGCFQNAVREAYGKVLAAYGRGEPANLDEQIAAKTVDGLVDFGDLDETMQRVVLEKVSSDETCRRHVFDANPGLETALAVGDHDGGDAIAHNRQIIRETYSFEPSGRRLIALYEQVAASDRGQAPEPLAHVERILDGFLNPARFRLIRS